MRPAFPPVARRSAGRYALALAVVCLLGVVRADEQPAATEYTLKAALVYKLAKFVAWPQVPGAAGGEGAPAAFRLCVVGTDQIADALAALAGRTIGKREIAVFQHGPGSALDACELVYFTSPPSALAIKQSAGQPTLTVSDAEGFADRGGMVEITRQRKRLGFRINAQVAREAGLTVAAPLLDLATVVDK